MRAAARLSSRLHACREHLDELREEQHIAEAAGQLLQRSGSTTKKLFFALNVWRDQWQLMHAVQGWQVAAQRRRAMRYMTAAAYEHRYFALGRTTLAAWHEGIIYNQKVRVHVQVCTGGADSSHQCLAPTAFGARGRASSN